MSKPMVFIVEITRQETRAAWIRARSIEEVHEILEYEPQVESLWDGGAEWADKVYNVDRIEEDQEFCEGTIDLDLMTPLPCPGCEQPLDKIERIQAYTKKEYNRLVWNQDEYRWENDGFSGPEDMTGSFEFIDKPYVVCAKCKTVLGYQADSYEQVEPIFG